MPIRLAAPAALMLVAGCAATPGLGPRAALRTPETVAASRSLAVSGTTAWPTDAWWQRFADPQLDALIEEALRNSPDVAAALARFRRADAVVLESRAATLPRLDGEASVYERRQSLNTGFPDEFKRLVPKGWRGGGEVAGTLGFDLDLWGRNRAALAAATSESRAAEIDTQQARLMLSTGVASAYLDLDRLFAEREVRKAALDLREATRELVADRMANGLETRGSLRQAEAEAATARADLAAAELMIALRRNQLAALAGAGPDRGLEIARPRLGQLWTTGLPEGVTTELLGRRPDIAAARARAEAAASRIDVARADFFPAVRLDALIGFQSLGLGQLFERDSTFGQAGPALSLPIFHGGELRGRYRGARASYDEAVATYNKAVVEAYREVADAVTGLRYVGGIRGEASAALAAAEEAYKIARLRYEGGLSNYLDVLLVEDRLLSVRLRVAQLDADARALDVALIRALGGGFGGREMDKDETNG